MLTVIDPTDIRIHFDQLLADGLIPDGVKLDGVTFERGGMILVDGSMKTKVAGLIKIGFDVKLKLVVKLLSDKRTVRIRLSQLTISGVGTRDIVMLFLKQTVQGLVEQGIPGLHWRDDTTGGYVEWVKPQQWVVLDDLQTNDNRLTLVVKEIKFSQMMAAFGQGAKAK